MLPALDAYLAAGQQSLQANKVLFIASIGLGGALWAQAVAPFHRTMWDAFGMCVKIAFPTIRAGEVVQLGALRDARIKRMERRAAALRGG